MNLLLLDTETTGTDTEKDHVIQIAWQVVDDNGKSITPLDYVFTKTTDVIPPAASAVNHITLEDIENAPSIENALNMINFDCKDHGVEALVCHNLAFDGPMLSKYPLPEPLSSLEGICTLKLARKFLPYEESHSLQYLRYKLLLPVPRHIKAHTADADVVALRELLSYLLDTTGVSVTEMIEICSKPIMLKVMPFGKHKGKRMEELPLSYLDWLLRLPDLDPDLFYTINQLVR